MQQIRKRLLPKRNLNKNLMVLTFMLIELNILADYGYLPDVRIAHQGISLKSTVESSNESLSGLLMTLQLFPTKFYVKSGREIWFELPWPKSDSMYSSSFWSIHGISAGEFLK